MSINLGPAGPAPSTAEKTQMRTALGAMGRVANTAAGFASANTVLLADQIGVETDTGKFKIGDGSTAWNSLGYQASVSDEAYNEAAWNGVTDVAPSKNAVRDKIESLLGPTALTFAGVDPNVAGPTGAYNGQLLRCTGTDPDSWWKWLTDAWILETETTATILDKLKGAAADTDRIGAEYMPDNIEVNYISLADDATAVIPNGALARVGNRLYMGDGVLDGGRRIGSKPLFITAVKQLDSATALKTGTGLSDRKFVEIGRIEMDPELLAVGKIMSMCGKVKFSATAAPGAQRRFTLIPASIWDVYVTDPEGAYASLIEAAISTTSGSFGFIPGNGTTDNTVTEMDIDVAMSAIMTLQLGDMCYWLKRTKPIYGRGYNWLPTPSATTQVSPVGGSGSFNFDITVPDEQVLLFSIAANLTTVVDIDVDLRFGIQ